MFSSQNFLSHLFLKSKPKPNCSLTLLKTSPLLISYISSSFNQSFSLAYKYFCVSENKSVFNWTFCQLLTEKPNCMKTVTNGTACFQDFYWLEWAPLKRYHNLWKHLSQVMTKTCILMNNNIILNTAEGLKQKQTILKLFFDVLCTCT